VSEDFLGDWSIRAPWLRCRASQQGQHRPSARASYRGLSIPAVGIFPPGADALAKSRRSIEGQEFCLDARMWHGSARAGHPERSLLGHELSPNPDKFFRRPVAGRSEILRAKAPQDLATTAMPAARLAQFLECGGGRDADVVGPPAPMKIGCHSILLCSSNGAPLQRSVSVRRSSPESIPKTHLVEGAPPTRISFRIN
jgi:hypothetical protein